MERSPGELALLREMNISSFREVNKDRLLDLVGGLTTLDPQAAMRVLEQVPQLMKVASEFLAESAGTHQDALAAAAHSGDQLQELRARHQQALIELLARKDVSDEVLLQALTNLNRLDERASQDTVEHRRWLSFEVDKRRAAALTIFAGAAVIMLRALQGGQLPVPAMSRLLSQRITKS